MPPVPRRGRRSGFPFCNIHQRLAEVRKQKGAYGVVQAGEDQGLLFPTCVRRAAGDLMII